MKWKSLRVLDRIFIDHPPYGTTRVKKRFLFLPKCIDDEWRWLEKAQYIQEYKLWTTYVGAVRGWKNISWLDK